MTADKLIGTWWLYSSVQTCNGVSSKTFGDPPSGQIQYAADGRMSAFLMDPEWKDIGQNASKQADIFFAYAGTWELDAGMVHHTIEFCSAPSKIGTTFVRNLRSISDKEIELTTVPETTKSGNVYQTILVWKKYADI